MIKVVARKVKNISEPMKARCWNCDAEIEYDEEDVVDNRIKRPDCGQSIWVGKEGKEIPKFPDSFFQFGVSENSVKISEKETADYVKHAIELIEEEPIVGGWVVEATGDTMVIGLRSKECDRIIVCKNYWEDSYNYRE